MTGRSRRTLRCAAVCVLMGPLLTAWSAEAWLSPPRGASPEQPRPWHIVVMDPLCDHIACDCVAGYARRDYGKLCEFLRAQLHRHVEIAYAESLALPGARAKESELIVGKFSEVAADAARAGIGVRALAMLSDKDGKLTQCGLFIVRGADQAKSIQDLHEHRILLGPADAVEKHAAALASLEAFRLPLPAPPATSPSCSAAALAVVEKGADAAVVSSYAMPLLEGCGTIDKGAVRIVGRTDPVPFIGLFATDRVGAGEQEQLLAALAEARKQMALMGALESRDGWIALRPARWDLGGSQASWPDWRGPRRDAISGDVPRSLPREKRLLWSRTLTGRAMSGVTVAGGRVVVADKDMDEKNDVFRCLDADTGRQLWTLSYPAADKMDFSNAPRATPVISEGLVYLLGAFGELHCLKLKSGELVWKRNLIKDFGAKLPAWGTCSTPLLVDERLIVNPGAKEASLVALDRRDGRVLWSTPGELPGYASFILAVSGGKRQIIGYDAVSLGGWEPDSGKRLWRLVPKEPGDFNVPTPLVVDGKLLVATENNGTRLYGFDAQGKIDPTPLASNADLIPDMSTPVVQSGRVLGSSGKLLCLDLKNGLRTVWQNGEEPFAGYCSLIAGNGWVLVLTQNGRLCLLKADASDYRCVARLDLFEDVPEAERDTWSHPALVGNRFYVRNGLGVYCFLLE
jgi:outer membrane protein assembly factor BamB